MRASATAPICSPRRPGSSFKLACDKDGGVRPGPNSVEFCIQTINCNPMGHDASPAGEFPTRPGRSLSGAPLDRGICAGCQLAVHQEGL
eukprot:3388240-Pyramimonas_sp.AAC.1